MLKKQYSKTKPTCKVTFTIAKEALKGASSAKVLGEFNNWNPALGVPMKLTGKEFKTVIELPIGRDYQFRYLGSNGEWENDWAADDYVEAPFNVSNSVVSLAKKADATKVKTTTKTKTKTKAKAKTSSSSSKSKANAKSDTKVKSTATGKVKANSSRKKIVDDLKKIEGIGPKIAELLANEGICTFKELGKATKTTLKGILENAGSRYKMHDPSTWAKQAKVAAKGDWAKLKQLQKELVGGKKR